MIFCLLYYANENYRSIFRVFVRVLVLRLAVFAQIFHEARNFRINENVVLNRSPCNFSMISNPIVNSHFSRQPLRQSTNKSKLPQKNKIENLRLVGAS